MIGMDGKGELEEYVLLARPDGDIGISSIVEAENMIVSSVF